MKECGRNREEENSLGDKLKTCVMLAERYY